MPMFEVELKRDCKESTVVTVEAPDEDEAERLAIERGENDNLIWEVEAWDGEIEATDIKEATSSKVMRDAPADDLGF